MDGCKYLCGDIQDIGCRSEEKIWGFYRNVFPPPVTWILLKVTCNHCRQCDSRQTQTKGHCRNLYVHFGVWRDKTRPNWKGECFLPPNGSFTRFILLPQISWLFMHEDAMYQVHAINLLVLLWKLNRFEVLAKWCSLLWFMWQLFNPDRSLMLMLQNGERVSSPSSWTVGAVHSSKGGHWQTTKMARHFCILAIFVDFIISAIFVVLAPQVF